MYGGFIENSGGERERYEILVNNLESSCDSVQVQQVTGNIFTSSFLGKRNGKLSSIYPWPPDPTLQSLNN